MFTILKNRKKTQRDEKVRMIFTHNKANPPVNQWIREGKKCLLKNEEAKKIGDNIQVGWKQPKNLKRIVAGLSKGGHKKPPQCDTPGSSKCGRCRVSCPILKEGQYFESTNTGKRYPIRHQLNCNSFFLIYLATCKKCKGQYICKSYPLSKFDIATIREKSRTKLAAWDTTMGVVVAATQM